MRGEMQFRLALVTGATSGIGRELALLLSSKGVPLLLTGRNVLELNKLQEELSRFVPVSVYPLDLLKEEDRKTLVSLVQRHAPDLIVNNAGFGSYGPLLSLDAKEQLAMVEILVKAVVELTMEGIKTLKETQSKGVVLNVSSAASFYSMPWMATYAACKAFCTSFSLAADYELKDTGIRVLCSCPGVVKTGFRRVASGGEERGATPSFLDMEVGYAAKRMWRQIQKGTSLDIFDWKYRLLFLVSRLLPRGILNRSILEKIKEITPASRL